MVVALLMGALLLAFLIEFSSGSIGIKSGSKLTKFPVTAPDGTEFRVSFKERSYCIGKSMVVRLYLPRKRFGFSWVYNNELFDYDRDNIDYIALAVQAVEDYYDGLAENAERRRKQAEAKQRRANAVKAFEAWDGKIAEVDAE